MIEYLDCECYSMGWNFVCKIVAKENNSGLIFIDIGMSSFSTVHRERLQGIHK